MKINLSDVESFKNDKGIAVSMVINNYRPNAFLGMLNKLEKFGDVASITRVSPIRFRLQLPGRRKLNRIMTELAPEAAVLRLQYHIPKNEKMRARQIDMLNYLEMM